MESLRCAIDRALPRVRGRRQAFPGDPALERLEARLLEAKAGDDPRRAAARLIGLGRWAVDSLPDLGDADLADALAAVEAAARRCISGGGVAPRD